MCITAHPDDECGAFGGALLMARAAGVETAVICLTEGQAATNRGDAADGAELARLRRSEFAEACEVLGVGRGEVLRFPDGRLAHHDPSELIAALVERIRQWRPQVVLTFGGEGGVNLHRDHTVACMAATAAFHWAGRRSAFPEQLDRGLRPYWPQKLYYSATPFLLVRNQEERESTCLTPHSLTLELGGHAAKKYEAFRKHCTQAILLDQNQAALEPHAGVEHYLLVAARGLQAAAADHALFQGVTED
jgi:LmbE family N-acetylglucosaminyl deacetylase